VRGRRKTRQNAAFAILLLCSCAPLLAAAGATPPPPPRQAVVFTDVSAAAGIDFVQSFGDTEFSNLVEAVGSGAAWLDYDGDGWIDLYLLTGTFHEGVSSGSRPQSPAHNRLFRNRGDGTFEDVTTRAGTACEGCFSAGVTVGDYDNDGRPDIYVANFGANVLFHNRGDGTFEDVTRKAGVGDASDSAAAVWLDYDRDGRLDLYVGNYIQFDPKYKTFYSPDGFPGPLAYEPQKDSLYHNLGGGRFEEVSASVGMKGRGRAMSVTASDYDGDGYDDIYVTNDATENFLYHNIGGKRFEEVASLLGVAFNGMGDQTASMAVDFGDADGDGKVDILVSDNAFSSMYRNTGNDFTDISAESGLARYSAQFVGWGAFFFDFDNDGDLDIFKVNSDLSRAFGQEDQVLERTGNRYKDVSRSMGPYFSEERMGRGAAWADYDNDGDPDVIIANLGGRAALLRNDGGNANHSISLRLVGRSSNRDGIGAKVTVITPNGRSTIERRSSGGYLSQNDPRLLFGIGSATTADRVEVAWPSGKTQVLEKVPAGRTVTIEEP